MASIVALALVESRPAPTDRAAVVCRTVVTPRRRYRSANSPLLDRIGVDHSGRSANEVAPQLPTSSHGKRLMRSTRGVRMARRIAIALPAVAAIMFLAWPMLFTSSGMAQDWVTHLWFIWRQSVTIARDHEPSLFLNSEASVFDPLYAFYGGTLYALAGALAVLLGDAPLKAYVLSYLVGFASAYGGWYWMGRIAGLGRWVAHVPSLVFVCSGYYLTLIYARGDWPEFIAVSTIPLLVSSGLSVLRARRLAILPVLALGGSALVFFGSHNITMLWGSTVLALLATALVLAVPQARACVTRAGVIRVLAVVTPAALVNSWYLLPAFVYESRTSISHSQNYTQLLRGLTVLVSPANLFTFSRTTAVAGTPAFVLALPVLAIAWVLVAIAISLRHRGNNTWRSALWIVTAAGLLLAVMMTHPGMILDLPRPFIMLQFTYRLESYVLLCLAAAILCTLVLYQNWPQPWRSAMRIGILVVLIASGIGAIQQVDNYPHGRGVGASNTVVPNRYATFANSEQPPISTGGLTDYTDVSLPLVNPAGAPQVEFLSSGIRNDHVTIQIDHPPGELIDTNLAGAPYLVSVTGARMVGRDSAGHMVMQVTASRSLSGEQISLSRSSRLPVVLGRTVTMLALAFLTLGLAVLLTHRVWAAFAQRRSHGDEPATPSAPRADRQL